MKSYSTTRITSITFILIFCFSLVPCFSEEMEVEEVKLSLDRCIELALENNLDIAAQRIDPEISQLNYEIAESIFDPEFQIGSSRSVSNREPRGFISFTKSESDQSSLSLGGLIVTGAIYSVSLSATRDFLEAEFPLSFNPYKTLGLNFGFEQPLLKNFGREVTRYSIFVSKNNQAISHSQFRQKVIAILEEVEKAYWNLVGAMDLLRVQEESLKLAEDQLERNKIMVRVGTKAPIDITEAKATVAERVVYVINAENGLKAAEDALRKILNVYISPDSPLWSAVILPTDRPSFEKVSVDLRESIETALKERPELEETKLNLKNLELNMRYQRNQRLPELNLQGWYGLNGFYGTVFDFIEVDPDGTANTGDEFLRSISSDVSMGGAVDDIKDRNFVDWNLGLNFSIPIRNREATKKYIISKLQYDKANIEYRSLENSIAIEVKEAVREIEMSLRRLDATKASRILSKERLNAIQKKFENGMATNFEVSEYQQALAAAENEEINALIEYNIALLSLEKAKGSLLQAKGIILETESEI